MIEPIKLLHAADLHLDSPFAGLPPEQPQDFSLAGRTQIRRRQDRFEIVENGRRFHHSYYYIKKNFKSQ